MYVPGERQYPYSSENRAQTTRHAKHTWRTLGRSSLFFPSPSLIPSPSIQQQSSACVPLIETSKALSLPTIFCIYPTPLSYPSHLILSVISHLVEILTEVMVELKANLEHLVVRYLGYVYLNLVFCHVFSLVLENETTKAVKIGEIPPLPRKNVCTPEKRRSYLPPRSRELHTYYSIL